MKRRCSLRCTCLFIVALVVGRSPLRALDIQIAVDITDVMLTAAREWNQGHLEAFATCYKNAPDILFIGPKNQHGYAAMLASYRRNYPTPAAMGSLSFSEIEVQPLDERFATMTGHFNLKRPQADGGNQNGYYLLVFEKTDAGWKIIRDASVLTP